MSLSDLNEYLADAVDLFVMTKFDKCFNACNSVIAAAKCEPEQERNYEVIEAATALGIQALAESDMWDHAMSFITDVYEKVDLCPPRIVQVCILLYAHVKEYLPCHNFVQTWLRNPQNLKHKKCAQVVRVYAQHILCPTGSYETLKEVVQSCTSLTETERSALLQLPAAGRYEDAKKLSFHPQHGPPDNLLHHRIIPFEQENMSMNLSHTQEQNVTRSFCEGGDCDKETSSKGNVPDDKPKVPSVLQTVCGSLHQFLSEKLSCLWHQHFGLILLGVLAVWALVQTQTGDPVSSLGRFVTLWRAFLQRLGLLSSSD